MNKDLTVGEPKKVLWQFCMPLFGSIIFQQLYNIADSLVAGKLVGENALAAVGNSYEITLIFIAFAFGCNIGCSVIVSEFFGAKDYSKMKTAVYTSMIASGVTCLILMLIGLIGCGELLSLIHTPDEIFADSKLYLDIYVWGLPFVFFYNIATGIFSALGDSKTPFIFLAVSSTTNIAVDIWFVTAFDMGVAGVAWATFICQGISCVVSLVVIWKRLESLNVEGRPKLFSKKILGKFAKVAIPSTLQQSFVSVGNIIIQSVINGFGSGVIAGYSAAVKLNNLVITSFTTLANGISNYTAQNIGAGKYDRIKGGFKAGISMVWTLSLPLCLLYFFGGRYLLALFLNDTVDAPAVTEAVINSGITSGMTAETLMAAGTAMATGIIFLRILSPFYFVISAKLVADGILRGSSNMAQFMAATFTDLTLRVLGAIILSKTFLGATGIWCSWPVGWTIATVMSLWFYRRIMVSFDEQRGIS